MHEGQLANWPSIEEQHPKVTKEKENSSQLMKFKHELCKLDEKKKTIISPPGGLFSFENFSRPSQSLTVASANALSQYHLFSETYKTIMCIK